MISFENTDNNSNLSIQIFKEGRKVYLLDQDKRRKDSVVLTPTPLSCPRVKPQKRKFGFPPTFTFLNELEDKENTSTPTPTSSSGKVSPSVEDMLLHQLENTCLQPQKSSFVSLQLRQMMKKTKTPPTSPKAKSVSLLEVLPVEPLVF